MAKHEHLEEKFSLADKVSRLSRDEAARRYLYIINKLGFGLLRNEDSNGLDGKHNDFSVDPFIKKYAKKYLDRNYRIKNISLILEAEYVRKSAIVLINSHDNDLSEDDVSKLLKRYRDADEVLKSGLERVYGGEGDIPEGSFMDWYGKFFSADRMDDIREAMEIKLQHFNTNHYLDEGDLRMVNFGCLADEVVL